MTDERDIAKLLAAPFPLSEVKFKPQAVKNNRALAAPYVDVRAVMDRLDQAVGIGGWKDRLGLLPDGSVLCRLKLWVGDRWVERSDVGSPSEQPDNGDRCKAAHSDALKRAAVKFGVGRYLYRIPGQWVDWDSQKKQFSAHPVLPEWAMPAQAPAARTAKGPDKKAPANGTELLKRLQDADAELAAAGLCIRGALLSHVREAGKKAGYPSDLAKWEGPAIELAIAEAKAFKSGLPTAEEKKAREFVDKKKASTGSKA
jgi:hypothetical protein